jgi:hypothetical protein
MASASPGWAVSSAARQGRDSFPLERPSRVSHYLAGHVPEAWPARPWSDAPFLRLRPCLSWRKQWTRINLQEPWEVERIRRVADHRRQSRRRCQHIITAMTTSGTIKGRWWLHAAQDAASVAAQARRFAGVSPDHCSATGSTRRSHLTMLRAITSESSRRPKIL